jgi:hypothetical protein
MHPAAMDFVASVLTRHTIQPGAVIEIGGRNINGTVRPLFDSIAQSYLSIDLYDGPGVDLVADVCAEPLVRRARATCVVCCEVLEHAPDGKGICRWAWRALAPGGVFILTAANPARFTHSAIDGGPLHDGEYYAGVSEAMLARWLQPFKDTIITQNGADIYAVAWKRWRRHRT